MARRVARSPVLNVPKAIVNLVGGRWVDPLHLPPGDAPKRQDGKTFLEESSGLGFVFKEAKWVMTCKHVIGAREPQEVVAFLHDDPSTMHHPELILCGTDCDIALLKFKEPFAVSPMPLPAADAMQVSAGEEAFFWSPLMKFSRDGRRRAILLCLRHTMISAIQSVWALDPDEPIPFIALVDSLVPRGSSGSPLVRPDGHLIGMMFAEELRPSREVVIPSGLGRAIPVDALVPFVENLAQRAGISDLE